MNAKATGKAVEIVLEPVNNTQLANLCGTLDENLRQIETALDVAISRRGERFTLRGDKPQIARATEALQRFYALAKEPFSVDEIQLGLIEIINHPSKHEAPVSSQSPALLTRKTELH